MPAEPFDPTFFEKDPLFWPIAAAARSFADCPAWPPVTEYGTRIAHTAPVRFREQAPRPRGRRRRRAPVGPRDLYDGRIIEEGWVPTRSASWHDFLNMLVWATFPAAKWQLHRRQHRAQSSRLAALAGHAGTVAALPNARTREQDALALLDEGGALIVCRDGSAADVRRALAERRTADARALLHSGAAHAVIFGHALYESLVLHREDGWGAALVAAHDGEPGRDPQSLVRAADQILAAELTADGTFQSPDALVRLDLAIIRP